MSGVIWCDTPHRWGQVKPARPTVEIRWNGWRVGMVKHNQLGGGEEGERGNPSLPPMSYNPSFGLEALGGEAGVGCEPLSLARQGHMAGLGEELFCSTPLQSAGLLGQPPTVGASELCFPKISKNRVESTDLVRNARNAGHARLHHVLHATYPDHFLVVRYRPIRRRTNINILSTVDVIQSSFNLLSVESLM